MYITWLSYLFNSFIDPILLLLDKIRLITTFIILTEYFLLNEKFLRREIF